MTKVTCDMATSVDGFVAGPNQSLANPFGEGVGNRLHRWMFEEPEANAAAIEAITAAGAFVMGRDMFGPGRDAWDEEWKGWWGDDPPYLGAGERLFDDVGQLTLEPLEVGGTGLVTHLSYRVVR